MVGVRLAHPAIANIETMIAAASGKNEASLRRSLQLAYARNPLGGTDSLTRYPASLVLTHFSVL